MKKDKEVFSVALKNAMRTKEDLIESIKFNAVSIEVKRAAKLSSGREKLLIEIVFNDPQVNISDQ